jgi:hypothetical protein
MDKAFCMNAWTQRSVRHKLPSASLACDVGSGEARAQRALVDPVDREPLAVELDDRDGGTMRALELPVTRDVHLAQLEAELGLQALELLARDDAEVAAGSLVEGDDAQG